MAEHADAAGVNGAAVLDDIDAELETSSPAVESGDDTEARVRRRLSPTGTAVAMGLAFVVALGSLLGWLGYRAYGDRHDESVRDAMVVAARQGATNLTTLDFTRIDADIARILDSSIGTFHDDFQQRAQPFIDVVRQAQSRSEGTVTSAGLESQDGDRGRVLVVVSVKTSNVGAQEQEPRAWRMRIDVQKVADTFKLADVQFVP